MSKPRVYVVGGSGYVGRRLDPKLRKKWDVRVIDPGYLLFDTPDTAKDVTAPGFEIPDDDAPVVWLACVHRIPPAIEKDPALASAWDQYAQLLMECCPVEWHDAGHPIVYVSSAQVITQRGRAPDVYAAYKSAAEQELLGRLGATVIRPGTVWGGLNPKDRTSRIQTVVNRYCTTGVLPDEHWASYTTRIWDLVKVLVVATGAAARGTGDVYTISDLGRPAVAQDLQVGKIGKRLSDEIEWPAWPHPMELLAKHRGLPWPKETS